MARGLKINGFVRNMPDGNVELVGEGEEEGLNRLIDWCRKGPPGAHVINVETKWEEPTGEFTGFNTR
jgi:acylphosphatase